jgi:hypothetical protein
MSKQRDEKLPADDAKRARDDVLKRMLKTPPKTHAGKPGKAPAPPGRRKLKLAKPRATDDC